MSAVKPVTGVVVGWVGGGGVYAPNPPKFYDALKGSVKKKNVVSMVLPIYRTFSSCFKSH